MGWTASGSDTYCRSCEEWVPMTDMDIEILRDNDCTITLNVVCGHIQVSAVGLGCRIDHELVRELNNATRRDRTVVA